VIAVLDASVAVEIALDGPHAESFRRVVKEATAVFSPDLMAAEVANALWKYQRYEKLEVDVCFHALQSALELPTKFIPNHELATEALSMS